MATDQVVYEFKEFLSGISPVPPTMRTEPTVTDLVDCRCGGLLEKLVFTKGEHVLTGRLASYVMFNHLGQPLFYEGDSFARIGTITLIRGATDSLVDSNWDITTPTNLPAVGKSICGIRGACAFMDYPGPGCLYLAEPGAFPVFDETAPVPSKLVFQQDNSLAHYGGAGFLNGLITFGDRSVSYWDLKLYNQQILSRAGVFSKKAWAASETIAFWLGLDGNLYSYDGQTTKKLGYAWLFSSYARTHMTFIEQTGDLFITVDMGTGAELVSPISYLYHGGLSRLSRTILHPVFDGNQIIAIGADGYLYNISLPLAKDSAEFDWSTYVPSSTIPDRSPDFVTSYGDFHGAQEKAFTGLAVNVSEQWPVWFRVTSNLGGTDHAWCSQEFPIGAVFVSGNNFKLEVWFPPESAGAVRISAFRVNLQGEDLRGLFATAIGQSASNG